MFLSSLVNVLAIKEFYLREGAHPYRVITQKNELGYQALVVKHSAKKAPKFAGAYCADTILALESLLEVTQTSVSVIRTREGVNN